MTQEITITRPDDWHLHVRDGAALAAVVPHTARQFGRAIIMPNLKPPVTTAAQALAPDIRVNAIGPGPTLRGARQSEQHFADQRAATILQRGADPSDVVAAMRYFLDAPSVTGQILCVDGGQHLVWRTEDVLGVE